MKKVLLTKKDNRILFFLLVDGKESAINVYREDEETILGNIYVGRVKDVVPNIKAAFVEFAPDKIGYFSMDEKAVFLNNKNTDKVCQGDLILVQVIKEAVKTKAPVLSSDITITGKYVVFDKKQKSRIGISKKIADNERADGLKSLLDSYKSEEYGFIVRTEAAAANDEEIVNEVKSLVTQYEDMVRTAKTRTRYTMMCQAEKLLYKDIKNASLCEGDEIVTDCANLYEELKNSGFDVRLYDDSEISLERTYSLDKKLKDATGRNVWLKNGGYLVIEPTEALTVIDVNTGKFDGKCKDKEASFLKINIEAAEEIARQLRLRNLSGIILIDFINMKDNENIRTLIKTFEELIKNDPVPTKFIDYTGLGLIEVTRQKIKKPLHEMLKMQ